ncbi:MAG: VWA domain-containing protein [Candidatus Aenigmarchaeota archaeon]|nr:VWA domain-containing protein [Candidatus Aenigmarchaeota archaeon]
MLVVENWFWVYVWGIFSVISIFFYFYGKKVKREEALKFTNVAVLQKLKVGKKKRGVELVQLALTISSLFFICLAASGIAWVRYVPTKSQNIVLTIDKSYSMLFEDYKPNRLEAAKQAVIGFLDKIDFATTKVGVVTFGPIVEIVQNLSTNKEEIKASIRGIEPATLVGTAIGDALIISSKLFPEDEPGTILLLTDGHNNIGIMLKNAIEILKRSGITVHAIGMGSPAAEFMEIDEEELRFIASETGGVASFSTTTPDLSEAYERISGIILRPKVVAEKFYFTSTLLGAALGIIILQIFLRSIFLTVP